MILAWILACLGLMVLPGPDMALVTKHSLDRSWRGGWSVVLGIYASFAIYSLAILLGIIPLIRSWPEFFVLARILGGAWLIYLGARGIAGARVKQKTEKSERKGEEQGRGEGSWRQLFASGFVSNFLNAKQYLFIFLLLPSFLPKSPSWADSLYLLLLLLLVSTLFWAIWIYLISKLGEKMKGHHTKVEIVSSLALIIVGLLLIFNVV